jgi:hypothetical protein
MAAAASLGGVAVAPPTAVWELIVDELEPAPSVSQVKGRLNALRDSQRTSFFTGVAASGLAGWRVSLKVSQLKKNVHVGMFGDQWEGTRAWDCAAIALRGQGKTHTNFDAAAYSAAELAAGAAILRNNGIRPNGWYELNPGAEGEDVEEEESGEEEQGEQQQQQQQQSAQVEAQQQQTKKRRRQQQQGRRQRRRREQGSGSDCDIDVVYPRAPSFAYPEEEYFYYENDPDVDPDTGSY